ncbi:hypothetical protein [Microvirga tunisiensis]|uniref:hypothetical protein n=1 Tax=Microvirga tunisiensis TaxID=2108360 RepID=UPI0030B90C6E
MARSTSQISRAKQLAALAAVLPMAAAERYAEVLTDADVAALKHLADTGMGRTRYALSPRISPILRPGPLLPPDAPCPALPCPALPWPGLQIPNLS